VLAPDPAVRLFVIHEIGKMECLSAEFVSAVDNLLALGRPLLVTVALSSEGLIERINRDPRVRLVQLTHAIGDEAPGEIVDALKRWDAEATAGRPNPDSPNRPDGE
jgi:nucleoside-triphosphatase